MIENTLDDPPTLEVAPIRRQPRRTNADHALKKRAAFEGEWDLDRHKFKKVTTDYVHLKCRECNKRVQNLLSMLSREAPVRWLLCVACKRSVIIVVNVITVW